MTLLLLVESSPRGAASASRIVAAKLVARLEALHPHTSIIRRDLAREPPPFVDAAFAAAIRVPPDARGPREHAALACSERLIRELESADILVLSTPMHNFTVPAPLKAWIDQVVRANRSFRSTPLGKRGLLADRPSYVITASGGAITASAARQPDFLTPYLGAILATIGIHDVSFLHLDALSRDSAAFAREQARAEAWMDDKLKPLALEA